MKLLILELDNVLVRSREGHEYVRGSDAEEAAKREAMGLKPRSLVSDVIVSDMAYEKLRYMKGRGFTIVVMTNQPLVAHGKRTIDDVYAIFYTANHLIGGDLIEAFFICPNDPSGVVEKYAKDTPCYQSKKELLFWFLDHAELALDSIEECIVVSDNPKDQQFATELGFKFRTAGEFLWI